MRDEKKAKIEILEWELAKAWRLKLGSLETDIRWCCFSYEKQCHLPAEIYWKNTDLIAYLDSHFLKPLMRAHLIPEIRHTITCLILTLLMLFNWAPLGFEKYMINWLLADFPLVVKFWTTSLTYLWEHVNWSSLGQVVGQSSSSSPIRAE